MLRLLGNPKRLCDGLTRRDLLHIGGLGAFGFSMADDLRLRSTQAAGASKSPGFGRARACILIYKYGSPPQHETFDPKPGAPVEVRGELGAIPTSVPEVRIGDHLPRIAQIMDRLTVVRSLTHPFPLHGTVYATTGIPEVDTKIEAIPRHPRQWPYIGPIVGYPGEPGDVRPPPGSGRRMARHRKAARRPGLHPRAGARPGRLRHDPLRPVVP